MLYSFNTQNKGFIVVLIIWSLSILLGLFYLFFIGSFFRNHSHELKVMSYNIWNYHSYWHTRKKGVAEVIRLAYPDIVLLQEVRVSHTQHSQLDDLMALLPFFKYSAFAVATPHADFNSSEGLGILSKHPIIEVTQFNFTVVPTDADTNTRTCLSAIIDVPKIGKLQVYVTHLSYERTMQCRQMAELLSFVERDGTSNQDCSKNIPKLVAGDFNIYNDFEGPSDTFTVPLDPSILCYPFLSLEHQNQEGSPAKFMDVWHELHPTDPGLTFSLMPFKDAEHLVPSKGLESRPDRLYFKTDSCVLRAASIHKTAGQVYNSKFSTEILFEQLIVHLTKTGWPQIVYLPPLLFMIFTLFNVPKIYIFLALGITTHVYIFHLRHFPSNPDDFFPSDHLALISTFVQNT